MSDRDREAFRVISQRAFAGASLVSLGLEMSTRRLTLAMYGALQGGNATHLGTLTFFGTDALMVGSETAGFPRSAALERVRISYDALEGGEADIAGHGWTMAFSFDGLAYAEHPAVIASLVDESEDES